VIQRVPESEPYPIQLKEHGVDFFWTAASVDSHAAAGRDPAHPRRSRARRAEFMDSQGYTLTDAPIFTPAACEGTTTLFEVNYIDDRKPT
jgi:asparaginyl-tRNA synthetase